MRRTFAALLLSPFVSHQLRGVLATERKKDIESVVELIEAGKVTPVIDRTCELADTADAIRQLQAGSARGKVVITL